MYSGIQGFWSGIRLFHGPLNRFTVTGILCSQITLECSAKEVIPETEIWLRKVVLDPPALVVNIVERRVIAGDHLEWVPWDCISTVVVNNLQGRESEKPDSFAVLDAGNVERERGTEHVQNEGLGRMSIESAITIGHVKAVVVRV